MAERAIWMRFLKRNWFYIIFTVYLLLSVLHMFVPSIFPDWLATIVTFFRDLD